ncbi:MAG: HlyD family efflux transporter periplasmic adaptor subunit, partial [Planctomycetales bacterium]|nr:HlyD family efflux transporter periplasmic adaptor subunit [Planctomycetales bacterium]
MKSIAVIWSDFPALEQVRTGRIIRVFARVTFILMAAAVVMMLFVPWRQTAPGTGAVVALDPQERAQPVTSAVKGVISYVKVGLREGSYVEKGELLMRVTPISAEGVQQTDLQIAAIESKLAASQSSLLFAEQAVSLQADSGRRMNLSLTQEYQASAQKWEQAKNEEAALHAELEDKRNQLRIAEEVISQGLVSQQELFSKRQLVEAQYQKVLKAENAVEEAYRFLLAKEEEI